MYLRAAIPDDVIMDYKRLVLDSQLDISTAEAIMAKCPTAVALPEGASTLIANADTQCYRIGRKFWDSLPVRDWMELFKATTGETLPSREKMQELSIEVWKNDKAAAQKAVTPWAS